MAAESTFSGFPRGCVRFFEDLKRNNTRLWFEQHKDDYLDYVLGPAQEFVVAMGERLRAIAPRVTAIPKVDRSLFRIHRDTRFSKDKSPYKTHLGIWLWEGGLPKNDNSGFYVQLEPPNMFVAAGIYIFSRPVLEEYRRSVVDPKLGPALARAMSTVRNRGPYVIGGRRYKKTPRGFDPSHKYAENLLYSGLYADIETRIWQQLHTSTFTEYCFEHFKNLLPLHRWLLALTERVRQR